MKACLHSVWIENCTRYNEYNWPASCNKCKLNNAALNEIKAIIKIMHIIFHLHSYRSVIIYIYKKKLLIVE